MTAILEQARYVPEDLLRLPEATHLELRDRELLRRDMSLYSTLAAGERYSRLAEHNHKTRGGWLPISDCGYECFPHAPRRVRRPDISLLRQGRLPAVRLHDGFCTVAPDLVAEAVSPGDAAADVDERVDDFVRAGASLVWLIYQDTRSVLVLHPDASALRLGSGDQFDGEPVLGGFCCPISELFPPAPPRRRDPDAANTVDRDTSTGSAPPNGSALPPL